MNQVQKSISTTQNTLFGIRGGIGSSKANLTPELTNKSNNSIQAPTVMKNI